MYLYSSYIIITSYINRSEPSVWLLNAVSNVQYGCNLL